MGSNKDRDYGFLGVGVLDAPWAPFSIDFNLANIGGPSAGLMFSLAVVDKLTTGDLDGGKFVAGTGTIDSRRQGRLRSAASRTRWLAAREAGATVFLVPADNCDEAKTAHETACGWSRSTRWAMRSTRCTPFPPVANLPVAEEMPRGRCVELWHVIGRRSENPGLRELASGYAAHRTDAKADTA